jgi:potassium-dependent mechanosensitive channel
MDKFSLKIILLIIIVLTAVGLLGKHVATYVLAFRNILTHPIVENISITTILLILPVLYLGQISGKIAQSFTQKNFLPYLSKFTPGGKQTFTAVIKNVTAGIVILFGLTIIGIDLSVLIGLLGVVGIGLGFGLQGVVANLFAGIVILVSKPVKVGDHIIVDATEGTLEEIRFLNSVVSTLTHESIIIPNSKIVDNPIHNFSFDDSNIIIKNSKLGFPIIPIWTGFWRYFLR